MSKTKKQICLDVCVDYNNMADKLKINSQSYKDTVKKSKKIWPQKNKNKLKIYNLEYRKTHSEYFKNKKKEWDKKNKEHIRIYNKNYQFIRLKKIEEYVFKRDTKYFWKKRYGNIILESKLFSTEKAALKDFKEANL